MEGWRARITLQLEERICKRNARQGTAEVSMGISQQMYEIQALMVPLETDQHTSCTSICPTSHSLSNRCSSCSPYSWPREHSKSTTLLNRCWLLNHRRTKGTGFLNGPITSLISLSSRKCRQTVRLRRSNQLLRSAHRSESCRYEQQWNRV